MYLTPSECRRLSMGALAAAWVGCAVEPDAPGAHALAMQAYCTAQVAGIGAVDVETDYLPHVVQCENGVADAEALLVQAVAARSYLYYKMETAGEVQDGPRDQVYSCAGEPTAEHRSAVEQTSGVFLQWTGVTVASFYVAGAHGSPPGCAGEGGDPTDTERWVTYNEGRTGDDVIQSPLGFVDPDNPHNRGCSSQNGADCLARAGRPWPEILRFYYGEDIEIIQATGPCIPSHHAHPDAADTGPEPQPDPPDAATSPGTPTPPSCQSTPAAPTAPFAWLLLVIGSGTRSWVISTRHQSASGPSRAISRVALSCGARGRLLPSQTGRSTGSSRGTS